MANQIKEGDVVQLKSGGPKMTISRIKDSDAIFCEYFLEGELKWVEMKESSLKKVSTTSSIK